MQLFGTIRNAYRTSTVQYQRIFTTFHFQKSYEIEVWEMVTNYKSCYYYYYYYYYYLKRLAMQGGERETDIPSVRRPQPHTTNL